MSIVSMCCFDATEVPPTGEIAKGLVFRRAEAGRLHRLHHEESYPATRPAGSGNDSQGNGHAHGPGIVRLSDLRGPSE